MALALVTSVTITFSGSCPSPETTKIIDTRRPCCRRRQLQVRRKVVLLHCATALEPSPAYCPSEGVSSRLSYIATRLMYLTLNGSDNCTATAPRPCNGLPMLRRSLEVVRLIIIITFMLQIYYLPMLENINKK